MTIGYDAARLRAEAVAGTLNEIACLIGERPSADQAATGLGLAEDAALLEARAADLTQGLFKIIVLGEFKNGKSTLLNAMLGNKTLPAKAAPSTAIITVLVHGDRQEVAIYDAGNPQPSYVSWEEFIARFQLSREDQERLTGRGSPEGRQVIDRFSHIAYAQVECRHPICANGVRLIDSPGLGEHVSRTRVATDFLRQAHAVILVLNATRILGQQERDFIENVLARRRGHIFFVVNRINQVDPGVVGEIRAWVEEALAPSFRGEETQAVDTDLLHRRVFFVDALTALQERMNPPADEARLEATGVPALERELERFLTGEEKVGAALRSTVETVRPIVGRARRRIAEERAALDQPLEELEARRDAAERQLRALQARKDEMERTILLFADTIKQKVFADLRAWIDQMDARWSEDSRLIELDKVISVKNLLVAYAQKEARERMAAQIGEQVQRYLQLKFGEWAEHIPGAIHTDIEAMVAEIEAQIEDFQLELDQIAAVFSGLPVQRGHVLDSAHLFQLALSQADIGNITDKALDPGDWTAIIGRMAQQAVAVMVVGTLVTGGNLLIALLLVEIFHLGMQENEVKKKLRESLRQRLHANLEEQVMSRRAFIYEAIEGKFRQFAAGMTATIQRQIDEVRQEQDRIIRRKQDEDFSAASEKARLDALDANLSALFDRLTASIDEPVPAV